jgi:multisubunit Na+/H+ antiporter MnhG subunit
VVMLAVQTLAVVQVLRAVTTVVAQLAKVVVQVLQLFVTWVVLKPLVAQLLHQAAIHTIRSLQAARLPSHRYNGVKHGTFCKSC